MKAPEILAESAAIAADVIEVRRTIHANPELSFREKETARFLAGQLTREGMTFTPIAGTGLLVRIDGTGDRRRAVALRADIDALPVEEKTGLDFASKNEGVMHACGHDMHAATLLGALKILNKHKHKMQGTVFGLFQPGEELCPGGASMVMEANPFEGYEIVAVVGEHVDPDLPVGTLGFHAGKYMASSDEIRITVNGKGGHAAMPHKLNDPVVAAAAIIGALQDVVSREAQAQIPTVLSIGRVIADGATNVIPDSVYMEGTLRTFDETWRKQAKKRVTEIAQGIASGYGTSARVDISDGYPCVVNSKYLTGRGVVVTGELFGGESVEMLPQRMTAEDFGYYSQIYPSLFYRLGVGSPKIKSGGLHTSTFVADEKALEYGVAFMVAMAFDALK